MKHLSKDIKDFRKYCRYNISLESTVIYAILVHKDKSKNTRAKIQCNSAVPIGGYEYIVQNDAVLIRCVNYMDLGKIGVSYTMNISNVSDWNMRVVMPASVVQRYLSYEQRKKLRAFKKPADNNPDIQVEYLQMLSVF